MCGVHGRSVFTATCLAVSRYFATAGWCSAAFAHLCKGIPRRPSNRTFVAVPQLKRRSPRHPPPALFLCIQDLVFRKLLTMSSVKNNVNPSDVGTKALGRERFHRLRSMLDMANELSETSSPGKWYSGDE